MSPNDNWFMAAVARGELTVTRTGRVHNNRTGRWFGPQRARYHKVWLQDLETHRTRSISTHRLVWLVFGGPIPDGHTVNHKNGIKPNNRFRNLEVGPHVKNIAHSHAMGLQPRGERNWNAKLSNAQVRKIRALRRRRDRPSIRALAAQFQVSFGLISAIDRGIRRRYG